MFSILHSALTAYNCVKLHYPAYSLPQEEEGRKRGPRQEIYISQSLCIDNMGVRVDCCRWFLTKQIFFFRSMTNNNKIRSLLISPPTTSDEFPEYTVREICVSQTIFTASHRILPPTLLLTYPEPGFLICSSWVPPVSSTSKRLGTLIVNATATSCFPH